MSDETEHPVKQPIYSITFTDIDGYCAYTVGKDGITLIEPVTKSGMYANIPYLRVWATNICIAEFCQHNLTGIYFEEDKS